MEVKHEVNDSFLYVTVSGDFDCYSVKDIVSEVIEKAYSHGLKQILCDMKQVKGFDGQQISIDIRFKIAAQIADLTPIDFRLAILETPMQLIGGKYGESVMSDKGVTVKVTSSIKEALEWLGVF